MNGGRMADQTLALLRHIEVHGPRTQPELIKGLQVETKTLQSTVGNLVHMGYLAKDQTTRPISFTLTNKARIKLKSPDMPLPGPRKQRGRPAIEESYWAPTTERRSYPTIRAYNPADLAPALRPGAMDAFTKPSRLGDRLHYRDGRVTDLDGNPLTLTP